MVVQHLSGESRRVISSRSSSAIQQVWGKPMIHKTLKSSLQYIRVSCCSPDKSQNPKKTKKQKKPKKTPKNNNKKKNHCNIVSVYMGGAPEVSTPECEYPQLAPTQRLDGQASLTGTLGTRVGRKMSLALCRRCKTINNAN